MSFFFNVSFSFVLAHMGQDQALWTGPN